MGLQKMTPPIALRMPRQKQQQPSTGEELIVFPNADKEWHESWTRDRSWANFPHPYRAVACGPPNSGKTSALYNLVVKADPPFERIVVWHIDPEGSREWSTVDGAEMVGRCPQVEDFDPERKNLLVIEDVDLGGLRGEEASLVDRLFGYVSTHRNVSVVATSQDPFRLPASLRRSSNVFLLWRSPDLESMATIGRRIGLKTKDLESIFNALKFGTHDFLCADLTPDAPCRLRKNFFEPILGPGERLREYRSDS